MLTPTTVVKSYDALHIDWPFDNNADIVSHEHVARASVGKYLVALGRKHMLSRTGEENQLYFLFNKAALHIGFGL